MELRRSYSIPYIPEKATQVLGGDKRPQCERRGSIETRLQPPQDASWRNSAFAQGCRYGLTVERVRICRYLVPHRKYLPPRMQVHRDYWSERTVPRELEIGVDRQQPVDLAVPNLYSVEHIQQVSGDLIENVASTRMCKHGRTPFHANRQNCLQEISAGTVKARRAHCNDMDVVIGGTVLDSWNHDASRGRRPETSLYIVVPLERGKI